MLRKLSISVMVIMAFLCFGASRALAVNWSAYNYQPNNNNHISDPTALASNISDPKYINVGFNISSQIIVDGVLYYSDGKSASTLYAYRMADIELLWSKSYSKQILKLAYDQGHIFYGAGTTLFSIEPLSGEENWSIVEDSTYNIKVFHAVGGRIYADMWYSNLHRPVLMNENDGSIIARGGILVDSITDITLSPSKIYVTAGRYYGGGSTVYAYETGTLALTATSQTCRSSSAYTIYDEEENKLYLSASNAALRSYRGDTLDSLYQDQMWNLSSLAKYGNEYYGVYGRKIYSFSARDDISIVNKSNDILPSGVNFTTRPIIVNGVLYAGSSDGSLLMSNLETKENKIVQIDNIMLYEIIYGSGQFIITSSYSGSGKIFIYNFANLGWPARSAGLSVMSPYNTAGMNQYLGQTHAHVEPESIVSGGGPWITPPSVNEVELRYKDAGYDFISLTEHNWILPNPAVTGILHIENSEEITQEVGGNHILAIGINTRILPNGTDQESIDSVVAQGGVPVLAHPNSSFYPFSLKKLISLESHHLEIFNTSVESWRYFGGSGISIDKWDIMLNRGKYIFATAGDDYTPYDGGFNGGAISVFSPSDSREDILANIRSGNFYALEGSYAPRITSISSDGIGYYLSVNEPSSISFIGKGGKVLKTEIYATNAAYTFQGDEGYVRAEVVSAVSGKKAWSQAVMLSNPIRIDTGAGEHDIPLPQAILNVDTTDELSASTINWEDYPEASPPSGYLSPVYKFETAGQVLEGTKLTINYRSVRLTRSVQNLAIFTYNEMLDTWQAVETTVDAERELVWANLNHFSLYTLSERDVVDEIKPAVSLASPSSLGNISGEIDISAEASDNEAVTSVSFFIDNRLVYSDIDGSDGWTAIANTSEMISGEHQLLLHAEDFAGNYTEMSYTISIDSAINPIQIVIETPPDNGRVYETSEINGSYDSYYPIESIGVYLDEIFIGNATLADGRYAYSMNWEEIRDDKHELKVILTDNKGNQRIAKETIDVGKKVEAVVVSPENKSYLRGSQVNIQVDVMPADEAVEVSIDGNAVANGSSLDLLGLALGEHVIEVRYGSEKIAESTFSVITSLQDTKNIVWRLYREGQIKNFGLANAICVKLSQTRLHHDWRLNSHRKNSFQKLIDYIQKQANKRHPKISPYATEVLIENITYLSREI